MIMWYIILGHALCSCRNFGCKRCLEVLSYLGILGKTVHCQRAFIHAGKRCIEGFALPSTIDIVRPCHSWSSHDMLIRGGGVLGAFQCLCWLLEIGRTAIVGRLYWWLDEYAVHVDYSTEKKLGHYASRMLPVIFSRSPVELSDIY